MGRGVSRPIFVVGSGRSGTSLLFQLLTGHVDLAWVANLADLLPILPQVSRLCGLPGMSTFRAFAPSLESAGTYRYCGITNELLKHAGSSLAEADVTRSSCERLRWVVSMTARHMGRPRFVSKNTSNTMRMRYLRRIFPDALFVHIIRSGYGVVNSLLNTGWWPSLDLWWLGKTPEQWEKEGGNRFRLCALHWQRQVMSAVDDSNYIPDEQYIECRYEDLVTDAESTVRRVAEFCGLEWSPSFLCHIRGFAIDGSRKDSWRSRLSSSAIEETNRAAGQLLRTLGYSS